MSSDERLTKSVRSGIWPDVYHPWLEWGTAPSPIKAASLAIALRSRVFGGNWHCRVFGALSTKRIDGLASGEVEDASNTN